MKGRKPFKVESPKSRSGAAIKAWATRRSVPYRVNKSEAASKEALAAWCSENNWKLVFFEGASGSPRTGIVDAVMIRIKPGQADSIEVRFVQLKSGVSGLKGSEIARLKKAVQAISVDWLLAAFDGDALHLVPDVPRRGAAGRIPAPK
jgi:hypothetical protein